MHPTSVPCKPCPFCGNAVFPNIAKQVVIPPQVLYDKEEALFQPCEITCANCGAYMRRIECYADHGGAANAGKAAREKVVEAWNTRAALGKE